MKKIGLSLLIIAAVACTGVAASAKTKSEGYGKASHYMKKSKSQKRDVASKHGKKAKKKKKSKKHG